MMVLSDILVSMPPVRRISLNGSNIAYRQAGSGPPIILLHGWASSSRYWIEMLDQFSDSRSLYALDMPGFGDSEQVCPPAGMDQLAELTIAAADALGLAQFDLVGHSYGASIAALVAARNPQRVGRLVLTSFAIPPTPIEQAVLAQAQIRNSYILSLLQIWQPCMGLWRSLQELYRPLVVAQWSTPPMPQLLAAWYMERPPADNRVLEEGIAVLAQMELNAALLGLISIGAPEINAALPQIPMPTLVVVGDRDRVMPVIGAESAVQLLPNGRLTVLDNCGHIPMFEAPDAYYSLLREFLS